MTGRFHIASGFIVGAAVSAKCGLPGYYTFSCMLGAAFPDTDHPKSILGRYVPLWRFFTPHRMNATHGWRMTLCASVLWGCGWHSFLHGLFFCTGYLLHLSGDSLTEMGVPWNWPDETIYSFKIKTRGELLILLALYTIMVIVMSVL